MSRFGQTQDPTELVSGSPAGLRTLAEELRDSPGTSTTPVAGSVGSIPWAGVAAPTTPSRPTTAGTHPLVHAADAFHTAAEAIRQREADERDTARDTLNRAREQVDSAAVDADRYVDGARDAAPKQPRLAPFDAARAAEETVPTVYIDADKYPETARHVLEAQSGTTWRGDERTEDAPHPSTVTVDRPNAEQNRRDSLRGIPTRRGYDRDEYPPAMFEEGGTGASVKYPSDNRGAGSSMGGQIRALELDDGEQVNIVVINGDEEEPEEPGDGDGDGDGDDGGDDGGDDDGGDDDGGGGDDDGGN